MEVEAQTSSTESTPASSQSTTQTSTPAAPEASTSSQTPATTAGTEQTPAWSPDFKFKAAGAEHEIPEMYRGLIKDQKTLEEVKRLHEKSYGLDALAQNRDALKKQISEYTPKLKEYETVSQNFAKLSHFVENKDFDSFFSGLGIPEKDIVDWIQHKIDLAQASPEVRNAYDQNRKLMQQQYDQQQQLETYKAQANQLQQAQAYNQVHSTVGQVAGQHAQAYDAAMGENAFVQQVINRGIAITQATGQEPELNDVISMLTTELEKLGFIKGQQAAAQPGAAQPASTQGSPVPKQKPALPVIPAGGQSPVSTPVKSMADLVSRAAAMGV